MTRRRLWWRHLLSVLLAPAMMTVFIPAVIVWITGVDAPDLGTARALCCSSLAVGVRMLNRRNNECKKI